MGRAEVGSASQAHPWVFSRPSSAPSHQVPAWDTVRPCPTFRTMVLAAKSRARLELMSGRKDTATFQALC